MTARIIRIVRSGARRFYEICGGPPYRYWSAVVVLFAIFFFVVVLLDFFVYWGATQLQRIDFSQDIQKELRQVDEDALLEAASSFKEKEAHLRYIRTRPRFNDPSL